MSNEEVDAAGGPEGLDATVFGQLVSLNLAQADAEGMAPGDRIVLRDTEYVARHVMPQDGVTAIELVEA